MKHFYSDLAEGCNQWYMDASTKFDDDTKMFAPYVKSLGRHKYLMMTYSKTEFQSIKDNTFTIVDGLRDTQRSIESTE